MVEKETEAAARFENALSGKARSKARVRQHVAERLKGFQQRAEQIRRRRAASTVQRAYRAHLVRRYLKEWVRHRAAVRIQVSLAEWMAKRHQAALVVQRAVRPKVDRFMEQRKEVKRLTAELGQMLEQQRSTRARATFAQRFASGEDVDDELNGTDLRRRMASDEDDGLDEFLESLRHQAGVYD